MNFSRLCQQLLLLSLLLCDLCIQVLSCDNQREKTNENPCKGIFTNSHTTLEMPCSVACSIVDPKHKAPKASTDCWFFCPDCAAILYPKAEAPKTSTGKPKVTTLMTQIFQIATPRPTNIITQRPTDILQVPKPNSQLTTVSTQNERPTDILHISKAIGQSTTVSTQDDDAMRPTEPQDSKHGKSDKIMHLEKRARMGYQKEDKQSDSELIGDVKSIDKTAIFLVFLFILYIGTFVSLLYIMTFPNHAFKYGKPKRNLFNIVK